MFYFNPLASKNSLINGLRNFFLRSTREFLAEVTVLAKNFLFIVKWFFFNPEEKTMFFELRTEKVSEEV